MPWLILVLRSRELRENLDNNLGIPSYYPELNNLRCYNKNPQQFIIPFVLFTCRQHCNLFIHLAHYNLFICLFICIFILHIVLFILYIILGSDLFLYFVTNSFLSFFTYLLSYVYSCRQ